MPPAGLAGLLGGGASPREGMLAERLEWVREWAEAAHAGDADAQCRALACACRGLQVAKMGSTPAGSVHVPIRSHWGESGAEGMV